MKQYTRVPSSPLIVCDPYFSVWSPSDNLYDTNTCHWTGAEKKITGTIIIDQNKYLFMGKVDGLPCIEQTDLSITPTSSHYRFEVAGVALDVTFTTPLLLSDLAVLSRPCSYIDIAAESTDGIPHNVEVEFIFDEGHCYDGKTSARMVGGIHSLNVCNAAWMGKSKQSPLSHSGDDVTIDWGYLYAATPTGVVCYDEKGERVQISATFKFDIATEKKSAVLVTAYDDIASIMYFGDIIKGYWAKDGKTIIDVIEAAVIEHDDLLAKCASFDTELMRQAEAIAGVEYAKLCALAYRQSIAAHKLIEDKNGNVVFLSKECFSNACAATVDVSYPSSPLYLLYAPELVKGMMRPVYKFAQMPVWEYDFAPHDTGRYPYITGQVYGLKRSAVASDMKHNDVFPMYYSFPKASDIYELSAQMPVEECGNMLIMAAAVAKMEGNAEFSKPYMNILEKWVGYLIEFGADPGEQLCTDDFAGHLAHNVNLAAKAIMGIESYSILLGLLGRENEAAEYHTKAKNMAQDWERNAARGNHTALVFSTENGTSDDWSLKYNLVWDLIFDSGLFSKELYKRETAWYIKSQNQYGVPLDSRKEYTKSDWILWAAAMTDNKADIISLVEPITKFLEQTPSRVPFSDWYDTATSKQCGFQARSVQGGLFMPLLKEKIRKIKR